MTWPPNPPLPDLHVLATDLEALAPPVDVSKGLGMTGNYVHTYDAEGQSAPLPAEAQATVAAWDASATITPPA